MILDYYHYSGDKSLLSETFDTVHHLLLLFQSYLGESGLIEHAPDYMFMDWGIYDSFNLHHPPRHVGMGYLTAFYYKALQNGIALAEILESTEQVPVYEEISEEIQSTFHRQLWNEEKNMYQNGIIMAASEYPTFSQQTNTLAVLYDLAPKELQQELMIRILHDRSIYQAQPYFMHFVFDALEHAGLFSSLGINQLLRWNDIIREPPSTLKEIWGGAGFDCDYSHAWSATPSYQMFSKILGVKPITPGFKEVEISPQPDTLTNVEGSVPTPYGPITVKYRRGIRHIALICSLPEGILGRLVFSHRGRTHEATFEHSYELKLPAAP